MVGDRLEGVQVKLRLKERLMVRVFIVEKAVSGCEYVVYPSSYINPLKNISRLEEQLREVISRPCKVLIDLLPCNGNAFNRFGEFYFDGSRVDRGSIHVVCLSEGGIERVYDYYRENKGSLYNSVLMASDRTKYAV